MGLAAPAVVMVMRQVTAKMRMLGGPPRNVVYAAIVTLAVAAERLEADSSA